MGSFFANIWGTVRAFFQIGGPNGPGWNDSAGIIEARDPTNTVFTIVRGADPINNNDLVTKQYGAATYLPIAALPIGPTIVWRPGAVGVLPANVSATWAGVMTLFGALAGPVWIAVDTSLGVAQVPASIYDMQGRAYFMGATIGAPATTLVDILDGGQLANVARFEDMVVRGHGTVVNPLAFTTGGPAGATILWLVGARVSTIGAAAMISTGGTGYALTLLLDDKALILATGFGPFANVGATDSLFVYAFTGSAVLTDCIVANAAASLAFVYDGSVVFHTQVGDASGTWLSQRNPLDGPGTVLVWQPGATGVLARNLAPDWQSLMALFSSTSGPVTIAVDTSLGVATVPAGAYDMQSRASFEAAVSAGGFPGTTLSLADGAQLDNVASFKDLIVGGAGTLVHPLGFTAGGAAGASTFRLINAYLSTTGVIAMIALGGGGYTLSLVLEEEATVFKAIGPFVDVGAGDSFYVYAFTASTVGSDCMVANATASTQLVYDGSVYFQTQVGDASGTWSANRFPLDGPGPILIYRPGATGALARNVVADWPALMSFFSFTEGPVEIAIDTSSAPTSIPLGQYDFQERATFIPALGSVTALPLLNLPDGVQFLNPAGFVGHFEVRGSGLAAGSGLNPWSFTVDGQSVQLADGVLVTNVGDLPIVSQVGTQVYFTVRGQGTTVNNNVLFADSPGGGSVNIFLPDWGYLGANTVTSPTGGVAIERNPIAQFTPQPGITAAYNEQVFGNPGPSIVYRPGATGAVDGNVAPTWDRLMLLFAATAGPVTIAIDDSVAPVNIPVAIYDFQNRATFEPYQSRSNGGATIDLNIPDGAQLKNVSEFRGAGRSQQVSGGAAFHVIGNGTGGTGVNPLAFAPSPDGCELILSDHVTLFNNGTLPLIQLANGDLLYVQMNTGAAVAGLFCNAPVGAELLIEAFTNSNLLAGVVTGGGTTVFNYDTSVASNAQAGAAAWNPTLLNPGILKGQLALAAGTSGVLSAPGLSASSVIAVDLVTPAFGAGNLTRWFSALGVNRTYGVAGTFIINALDAAGLVQALDGSTVEYTITL